MGAKESLQRLGDKKQQEIEDLEAEVERAKIYLQAILDSIKVLPKEINSNGNLSTPTLRPGTALARARDAILSAGRPLHINEIVSALGKPGDKKSRVSLAGSISWYVRRGQVFTRPAANTFGLLEMAEANQTAVSNEMASPDLPDTFGG